MTETRQQNTKTIGPAAIDHSFTDQQLRRGILILIAFVGMRGLLWGPLWSQPSPNEPLRFGFLVFITILIGSVGLVYFGFTRWVGVDLFSWWIDREHIRRDLFWGIAGFLLAMLVTLMMAMAYQSILGPGPQNAPVGQTVSPAGTILLFVFGIAVASFQEETLFRGFLQTELSGRIGEWPAVVIQAAIFSVAHIGYYPLSAWYLFGSAFTVGLVYGWLRKRRDRLLAPGLAHGLLG